MECLICGSTNNQTLGDGTIICSECGEILKRGDVVVMRDTTTERGTQRKEKTTGNQNNGKNSGQKNRGGQK